MSRIISDIKKYKEYVLFAAKSQLKAEVANSKLNWIWWVLEPFCFMLVYSFVFGVVFNAREENHALFVFLGLSMWQFFSKCVKGSVPIIKKRRAVVSKVYIPKFMMIIQLMMVNGFKLLICMIITIAMMFFYRVQISWEIIMIVPVCIVLLLVTFGLSCFMMHIGVYLEDLGNIMDIFLRLMMYFTGVFYSIGTRFPAPYNQLVLKWNPVALLLNAARALLIYNETFNYSMLVYWGLMAIVVSYAGIQIIYKNENSYIKVV